ncbi:hypothetical protein [Fusibacter ferrireducens]|uniref:Uncharacterized protein n=1 Tax=Fusibacter ferrireducens TaxID=2785058 RepID=A0ABR9ZXA0_9FIRM|nr:hypothetical protein [Fusibacter ferrireducens]MBF4695094.1 hypothetical protein [Fusibacter ferrireducens]
MTNMNINDNEKENLLGILKWIIDPSVEDEKTIRTEIETKSFQSLFINIMQLDISEETKAKLIYLKNIIDELDGNHSRLTTDEGGEE